MIFNIPLLIAPLVVYNAFVFGFLGVDVGDPWSAPIFTIQMVSDARWTLTLGDVMIVASAYPSFCRDPQGHAHGALARLLTMVFPPCSSLAI